MSSEPAARSTISVQLFEQADAACARAQADSDVHMAVCGGREIWHTLHALDAIVLAVTAAEAGINEAVDYVRFRENLAGDFEDRTSLLKKWTELPNVVAAKTFDEETPPYIEFRVLVRLRHAVVHYKWGGRAAPDCFNDLLARGLALPNESDWITAALTNQTAEWALATVSAMFIRLGELVSPVEDPHLWVWGRVGFSRVSR